MHECVLFSLSQGGVLEVFRGVVVRVPPVPGVPDEGQPEPGAAFQRGRLLGQARAGLSSLRGGDVRHSGKLSYAHVRIRSMQYSGPLK